MLHRASKIFVIAMALVAMTSCTGRYQQLLMDKDLEIRDLQGRIAELTASNTDLDGRNRGLQSELSQARTEVVSMPREAAAPKSDLVGLQDEVGGGVQVRYRHGRISIGIENTVTFASGSSKLKKSAGDTLERVARVLQRKFSGRRIYVEGHTDTDPIRKTKKTYRSNRHLSAERADAVAAYLVKSCGLPERQIAVVGFGPTDPRDSAAGKAAKARNRRVEIVVGEVM